MGDKTARAKPETAAETSSENKLGAIQPEKFDLHSHAISDDKLRELLKLLPEARTEGERIDFNRLKLALGEAVDSGRERYGLTWPGRADCFKAIQSPSLGTLLPAPNESTHWDATENLIIEGDNLEVLKLLQKSYLGKVKMIYIDPPYNTGNDFIYPDDYAESLQTYLEYTGQVDSTGKKFSTNSDTEGRFHSKWLNMMYPRLYLARNLLREDGVLFVSIDDDEGHHLRTVLDELFGSENFLGCVVWNSTKTVTNTALISVSHTYNLVYARSKDYFVAHRPHFRLPEGGEGWANPDNDPRGPWKADPFQVGGERPNQLYPITNPRTGQVYRPKPGNSWKNEKKVFDQLLTDNRIVFGASGEAGPQRKRFKFEAEERGRVAKTLWDDLDTTANATRQLDSLMGFHAFDNPKPVDLVRRFVALGVHDPAEAIVLDFFAGSGTTAQAVLESNLEDGGTRRFVLVQLPEPTPEDSEARKAGFSTIVSICEERVRRVIKELSRHAKTGQDLGFRVYKLAESNLKAWDSSRPQDSDTLQRRLIDHISHTREGRSDQCILTELLLKSGFPPTTTVRQVSPGDKKAYVVGGGKLLLCLDRHLTLEAIRAMADLKPERVVCLDEGFAGNDQLKVNAAQTFKTKGIAFQTV